MSQTQEKWSVVFYSPGTFVSETTWREIDAPHVAAACRMAESVVERYGAKPYGFHLVKSLTAAPVPDGRGGTLAVTPKELERSGMHFLGGELRTLDAVEADGLPDERILRDNIRCNG